MSQIASARALTPQSHLVHRQNLAYSLTRDRGQIRLRCYGNETTFPDAQEEVLKFALGTTSFRVGDVPPHLQDASASRSCSGTLNAGAASGRRVRYDHDARS